MAAPCDILLTADGYITQALEMVYLDGKDYVMIDTADLDGDPTRCRVQWAGSDGKTEIVAVTRIYKNKTEVGVEYPPTMMEIITIMPANGDSIWFVCDKHGQMYAYEETTVKDSDGDWIDIEDGMALSVPAQSLRKLDGSEVYHELN
jgi:hypothetical protein